MKLRQETLDGYVLDLSAPGAAIKKPLFLGVRGKTVTDLLDARWFQTPNRFGVGAWIPGEMRKVSEFCGGE